MPSKRPVGAEISGNASSGSRKKTLKVRSQISVLLGEGYTQREIATRLGVSQSTVSYTKKDFKRRDYTILGLVLDAQRPSLPGIKGESRELPEKNHFRPFQASKKRIRHQSLRSQLFEL